MPPVVSAVASHSASRHYSHKAQQSIPQAWDWGNIVSCSHAPPPPAKPAGHICRAVIWAFVLQLYEHQEPTEVHKMCLNMNTSLYPDIFASQNTSQPFSWYILTFPCPAFMEFVHVNTNCRDRTVYRQLPFWEIGNATVYPIHNTECPLLIKCHSINVTLLCSFRLGWNGGKNAISKSVLS